MSGISQISAVTSAKRLQLLQKTIPTVSHVALLRDPTNIGATFELSHLSSAARELGLSYDVFDVSTGNDIDQALAPLSGSVSFQCELIQLGKKANSRPRVETSYSCDGTI